MNAFQSQCYQKLWNLGYTTSVLNADLLRDSGCDEHTWGFMVIGDSATDNVGRGYTRSEADIVAARLLEIGPGPVAASVRINEDLTEIEEPEFGVALFWRLPESIDEGASTYVQIIEGRGRAESGAWFDEMAEPKGHDLSN